MKVRCPRCRVRGDTDELSSGRRVKCPKCSTVFIVPWQLRQPVSPGLQEKYGKRSEQDFSEDPIDGESAVTADTRSSDQKEENGDSRTRNRSEHQGRVEAELKAELEGLLAATCSVCGKSGEDVDTFAGDRKRYCRNCLEESSVQREFATPVTKISSETVTDIPAPGNGREKETNTFIPPDDFSGGDLIKMSWQMTGGVKRSLWAGILVMFLMLFILGIGVIFLLTYSGVPPGTPTAAWLNLLSQLLITALAITFLTGLIHIGVRRAAGKHFSWMLVFSGFSRLGSIVTAALLMLLLIASGFFLLVLPGVYLAVGYSLALPLIVDRGVSPWKAMEMSRRAVHQKWWPIFGAYLLMYFACFLSMIPFGIGMLWTVPMFFMLTGVTYRLLFGEGRD